MPQIIQIGSTSYLAGMRWISYLDVPPKSDIKDDAERFNSSWYAIRNGEAIQGGYCEALAKKPPKKLVSLAAHLAESKIQPWLGVFEISAEDDLYWYIAVRDHHAILPDGDVVGSYDQVLAARQNHLAYGDWQYIDGNLDTLVGMLDNDIAKADVKSLNGSANALRNGLIAGGTALTVAACVGGYLWYQNLQSLEAAQRLAKNKVASQQQAAAALQDATRNAIRPLLTLPDPNELLSACRKTTFGLPLSEAGWSNQGFQCAPIGISVQWKREAGATVGHRPDGSLSADGETVSQGFPAVQPANRPQIPELIALADVDAALRDWAQRAGVILTISKPTGILPKPSSSTPALSLMGNSAAEPTLPYVRSDFSVSMAFSPFSLHFDIPGLFINRIKSTPNGNYTIEGVLYGTR